MSMISGLGGALAPPAQQQKPEPQASEPNDASAQEPATEDEAGTTSETTGAAEPSEQTDSGPTTAPAAANATPASVVVALAATISEAASNQTEQPQSPRDAEAIARADAIEAQKQAQIKELLDAIREPAEVRSLTIAGAEETVTSDGDPV